MDTLDAKPNQIIWLKKAKEKNEKSKYAYMYLMPDHICYNYLKWFNWNRGNYKYSKYENVLSRAFLPRDVLWINPSLIR